MRGPKIIPVDPAEFTAAGKPGKKRGRKSLLLPWQQAYVIRAAKLRRTLANKRLAIKFGVSVSSVKNASAKA